MIAAKPPEPHLVRGTASLNTQVVKLVAPLIVMKPAVIMELTLAQTVAAAHVNVAHQPPPPALHQVVALLQVVAGAHLQEEILVVVGIIPL